MIVMSCFNRNERRITADTSMEDIVVSIAQTPLWVEPKRTLNVVRAM